MMRPRQPTPDVAGAWIVCSLIFALAFVFLITRPERDGTARAGPGPAVQTMLAGASHWGLQAWEDNGGLPRRPVVHDAMSAAERAAELRETNFEALLLGTRPAGDTT